jgi:hypothetical protein
VGLEPTGRCAAGSRLDVAPCASGDLSVNCIYAMGGREETPLHASAWVGVVNFQIGVSALDSIQALSETQ